MDVYEITNQQSFRDSVVSAAATTSITQEPVSTTQDPVSTTQDPASATEEGDVGSADELNTSGAGHGVTYSLLATVPALFLAHFILLH